MVNTISKSGYARRHGVTRAAVQKWQAKGWVVIVDGLVDVAASDANLKRYRVASDARAKPKPSKPVDTGLQSEVYRSDDESPSQAAERIVIAMGADMDMEEAKRVKENYLALLHRLEYEQKSGALIELDVARSVLFDSFRIVRDAVFNLPSRYGAMIASDLDVPADKTAEVLTGYVHKLLTSLVEPEGLFG